MEKEIKCPKKGSEKRVKSRFMINKQRCKCKKLWMLPYKKTTMRSGSRQTKGYISVFGEKWL